MLAEHGIEGDLDFCPSQATISRFLSKSDVVAIKQLYLDGLRQKQCSSGFVDAHEADKQKEEFRIQQEPPAFGGRQIKETLASQA